MKTLSELGIRTAQWVQSKVCDDMILTRDLSCLIATAEGSETDSAANARLISAAPDLYEALQEVYEDLESMFNTECHECKHEFVCNEWAAKARAALEKAGGKE